jgi:integrase
MPRYLDESLIIKLVKGIERDNRREISDSAEPGLRLRMGPRTAMWSVIIRHCSGQRRRINLGYWPGISLEQARRIACRLRMGRNQEAHSDWTIAAVTPAIDNGFANSSAAGPTPPPAAEPVRTRILTFGEIGAIWKAADWLGPPFGLAVHILLATGARLNDVAGMRTTEVDLERRTWTLPASRTGKRDNLVIPLIGIAWDKVDFAISAGRPGSDLALTATGRCPDSVWSATKSRLDKVLQQARPAPDFPPWRLQDVRRTFAHLGTIAFGFRLSLVNDCLCRESGPRHSSEERREVFARWIDAIELQVQPE